MITRLKRYLFEHGIKQTIVVEKSRLGQSWINKVVNGKATPSVYDALRIAKAIGASVEDLWSLDDEPEK